MRPLLLVQLGQKAVRRVLAHRAARFVLIGGVNTLVTYGIFIGLGLVIPPGIAYTIAFAAGLIWVTLGSSKFVFGAGTSARPMLLFGAWYLALYAIGQVVVQLIAPRDTVGLAITSLAILAVTTPLAFLGGRYLFTPSSATVAANNAGEQES